jgi:glucose-1-phosphate cytidylyltransferase
VKVVLFCGGRGLRMREASEHIPKPMVPIGPHPVLLHVMKYYAHFGHNDFILCLGYKAHVIKEFFLNYNEALTNDFVLSYGGRMVELTQSDIQDWRITFVDTGLHANIGQRLLAVRPHLKGEEMFLANYGDTLTNAPLPEMVEHLGDKDRIASFLCVRPSYTFDVVTLEDSVVTGVENVARADIWINGGYFTFRPEVFDFMRPGEELVEQPFRRLIEKGELLAYRYEGFWAPMDTLKEQQDLEALYELGRAPWAVWKPAIDATLEGGTFDR